MPVPRKRGSRRPVVARRAMVACAHPAAAQAGLATLRAGGTAADAAVAVNAVLGVVHPCYCGIGGDLFCLYYDAASGEVAFLDGGGRSGSRASLAALSDAGLAEPPRLGAGSVVVPGCVDAWALLLERFGTKSFEELLRPAISLASKGIEPSRLVRQEISSMAPLIDDPEWRRIFLRSGRAPRVGETLAQPELARTLAAIARHGRAGFYEGEIAARIARRLAGGGFVDEGDLADHAGAWGKPVSMEYHGVTVCVPPPPTPGFSVLLALALLDGTSAAGLAFESPDRVHLLIEAAKLAYADHKRRLTTAEAASLLHPGSVAALRARLDPQRAGAIVGADAAGDTTGFVIVDERGNMASVIQSVFSAFGSGVVPEGTGVVLHNRGHSFVADADHPNALAPRKRPFHTLIAAMVLRGGRPRLGFATMAANGQAQQIHLQYLTGVLDLGMDVQAAMERPRFVAAPPHLTPEAVWIERDWPRETLRALEARGHRLEDAGLRHPLMGQGHAVSVEDGRLLGGADPRGDGTAVGY